jgi:hypothetical protein
VNLLVVQQLELMFDFSQEDVAVRQNAVFIGVQIRKIRESNQERRAC